MHTYLQIPMHPSHQCHFHFVWEDKHYKFQSLLFGLSSASWVFTKTLKPVIAWLRQIGLRLVVYLDDMLFMHANRDQLETMAPLLCRLFESLLLQLEARPGCRGNRCLHTELGRDKGLCQPPMVLDLSLSEPNKEARSQTSNGGTTMALPTMVSSTSPNVGRSSSSTPSNSRSCPESHHPGVHNESGSANLGRMAHLGNPTLHEEYLLGVQTCCSPHGGAKPTAAIIHNLQSRLAGVSKGVEIPLLNL